MALRTYTGLRPSKGQVLLAGQKLSPLLSSSQLPLRQRTMQVSSQVKRLTGPDQDYSFDLRLVDCADKILHFRHRQRRHKLHASNTICSRKLESQDTKSGRVSV